MYSRKLNYSYPGIHPTHSSGVLSHFGLSLNLTNKNRDAVLRIHVSRKKNQFVRGLGLKASGAARQSYQEADTICKFNLRHDGPRRFMLPEELRIAMCCIIMEPLRYSYTVLLLARSCVPVWMSLLRTNLRSNHRA